MFEFSGSEELVTVEPTADTPMGVVAAGDIERLLDLDFEAAPQYPR
jgi:hypothetical protein